MYGAGEAQDIHQGRHRHQNGVHGLAGPPDNGQAANSADAPHHEHHQSNFDAAEAEVGQPQSQYDREANQPHQCNLAFLIDGDVVDRRPAHAQHAARHGRRLGKGSHGRFGRWQDARLDRQIDQFSARFSQQSAANDATQIDRAGPAQRDHDRGLQAGRRDSQLLEQLVPVTFFRQQGRGQQRVAVTVVFA